METSINRNTRFLRILFSVVVWIVAFIAEGQASERWIQSDWSGGIGSSIANQYMNAENIIFSEDHLTLSSSEHWFDTSWRYRKRVTFLNASGEAMTSFQTMIALTASNFDFRQIQNDCRDLRITDSDGMTLLPYDLELCDIAGQRIIVWAKIPQVEASDTDSVYVYFGNTNARDAQNKTAVWDGYDRVLSFENTLLDNAHTGITANLVNASLALNPAIVGQGVVFDGSNDYVLFEDPYPRDVSNRSLKYDGGELTITTSVMIDSRESTGGIFVSKPYNGDGQYNYILSSFPNGSVYFSISGGTSSTTRVSQNSETTYLISERRLTPGQRAVISAVVTRDNRMKIFVNGEEWATQNVTVTHWPPTYVPGWSGDLNYGLTIGSLFPYPSGWTGNTGYSFQGIMDHFSLIHRERSATWMRAFAQQILHPEEWVRFNALETTYALRGVLTSNVFCPEGNQTVWESADIHASEEGVVRMKVRTGADNSMSESPDFNSCREIVPAGSLATNDCVQVGDDCIQYQIYFESTEALPEVTRISVTYQNASPPPPPPPPDPPTVVERVIERTVMVPADPVVPGTLRVVESEGTTRLVQRDGSEDSYTISLSQAPTAPVTITLTPDAFLLVSPLSLEFTPENWNQPQTITIRTIGRNTVQLHADAVARIQHMASSEDPHYRYQTSSLLTAFVQADSGSGGQSGESGHSGGLGGSGGHIGNLGGEVGLMQNTSGCSLLQIQNEVSQPNDRFGIHNFSFF